MYYSDRYIAIKTVNLILHAIVKTQPSTRLNLRPTKSRILGSTRFLEYNTIQPPTNNKKFRQISYVIALIKILKNQKSKNQKNQKIKKSKNRKIEKSKNAIKGMVNKRGLQLAAGASARA